MEEYKAVIVDDHRLFRKGLRLLLEEINGLVVCGESENGEEFLQSLGSCVPDIVLMDIEMPEKDGITTTIEAIKLHPEIKILALSMHSDEEYYYKMLDAGVKGFVPKNADSSELENAIMEILYGRSYFSNEILGNIVTSVTKRLAKAKSKNKVNVHLTKREQQILVYVCKGFSNIRIAELISISPRTVDKHRANLLFKTESKNSIHLVIFAIKNNLVDLKKM